MKKYIYFLTIFTVLAGSLLPTPATAVKHVVMVGNFFFNPMSLNVNVGDTVRWVWSAGNHTTTSTPGAIPAGAASWDALINSTNTSFEYKVTVAGSYAYVCTPHAPSMAGSFTAAAVMPTLSVAPSNRNVSSSSGSTTFTVTSNSAWMAVSNSPWCTVTPSGIGNSTITAVYSANLTNLSRTAAIAVTVTGLTPQTVTVTQAASTVGVDEQTAADLRVYPNPTKGVLKVKVGKAGSDELEISIFDISGKKILTRTCSGQDEYSFDLSGEPSGYYFVCIKSESATQVRKIVLM